MKINKSVLRTEVVVSDDEKNRYLLKKDFSVKGKEKVITVIMIKPSSSDTIKLDVTSVCVLNNISELGYNILNIINIFSNLTDEVAADNENNNKYILKSVEEAELVVWAVGTAGKYNKVVKERIEAVLKLIQPHKDKIQVLTDEKVARHPLSATVRAKWVLKSNVKLE